MEVRGNGEPTYKDIYYLDSRYRWSKVSQIEGCCHRLITMNRIVNINSLTDIWVAAKEIKEKRKLFKEIKRLYGEDVTEADLYMIEGWERASNLFGGVVLGMKAKRIFSLSNCSSAAQNQAQVARNLTLELLAESKLHLHSVGTTIVSSNSIQPAKRDVFGWVESVTV